MKSDSPDNTLRRSSRRQRSSKNVDENESGSSSDSLGSFNSQSKRVKTTENKRNNLGNTLSSADEKKDSLRKSSRTTKFSRSMNEKEGDVDYFFTGNEAQQNKKSKKSKSDDESVAMSDMQSGTESELECDNSSKSPLSVKKRPLRTSRRQKEVKRISSTSQKAKAPAVSHSSRRRKMKSDISVQSSEEDSIIDENSESSLSDEEDEEDEEPLKVQRVLASRSETRKAWKTIMKDTNTSEVENGSRWFQEDSDPSQDHVFEERFLIKWADVGYLHCSWELEKDLVEQIDGAKNYLNTFFRKSINGVLFDLDERGDGEYFNPDYVNIDRIIGIEYPEYDCVYTKSENMMDAVNMNKDLKENNKEKSKNNSILGNENIAKYGILLDKSHPDYEARTGRQFLIKWTNCGYADCTYEFERDLILLDVDYVDHIGYFLKRRKKPTKSKMNDNFAIEEKQKRRLYKFFGENAKISSGEKEEKVKEYQEKLANYEFPNGGKLRDYQAEGVSWILSNYINGRSSILADEMGLGKTLQTAIYINMLATTLNCRGPYLIIAPLSTVQHWQREFETWTDLNTIIYHGSASDRGYIREYEFAFETDRPEQIGLRQAYLSKVHDRKTPKWSRTWMVQVVITTPEIITSDDYPELCAVPWEVMVVDEAHKLKSYTSKLNTCLRSNRFRFNRALLLTGTPIQNNMKELWTLMNFVDADRFENSSDFLGRYGEMKSKERVDELHENIRPYILRRLKEDVEKSVPPKEETIIEIELTLIQKTYYRALYEKNIKFLHKNKKKALDGPSISNLAMQLRKCCNHPFLLNGVEAELRSQHEKDGKVMSEADILCTTSGKLVLLDKLLPRLKLDGHRVLMFSQFKIMLDVLEDYLRLRNMKYERIDGSITGQKRQMAIDRFQAKKQDGKELPHVMLLSTRAGGVGINLTAADTCIIYDSDWNPQNDLQAQARCHRIGQTKNVKVYRLLSRKSYEMQMFHMSSLKMGLDQAVLQGIENNGSSSEHNEMTKEEVERLLRHGAYDVFKEEKDGTSEKESNEFLDSDIDTILARRSKKIIHQNTGSKSSAAGGTFSKAVFKGNTNEQGTSDSRDIDVDDPEFWKKMVGEAALKVNEETDIIHKKRKRNVKNYSENTIEVEYTVDSDYDVGEESDSDESDYGFTERFQWGGKKEFEWKKDDVSYLIEQIAIHGYTKLGPVIVNFKKHVSGPRRYSMSEILRMIWSIVLVSILETAESDANDNRKRAATKEAKHKIELSEGKDKEKENIRDINSPENKSAIIDEREICFQKIKDTHSDWLPVLFNDAHQGNIPAREKSVIDTLLKKKQINSTLVDAFNENIWPALTTRGWIVEETEAKEEFGIPKIRKYSFKGGRQYTSVSLVMNMAMIQHPELKHVLESVQCKALDTSSKETNSTSETLSLKSVTLLSLKEHLEKYGSLQLLFDRGCKRPLISYPRKFLSTFSFVHKVNKIVALADKKSLETKVVTNLVQLRNLELQKLLEVSRKAPKPHPQWKRYHDAVLFFAISKHGWIDRSDHYKAMIMDTQIKWGQPFDDKQIPVDGESKGLCNDDFNTIEKIAKRAAFFLNEYGSRVDEFGFNKNLLVTTYGLRKEQTENENTPGEVRWIVDMSQNKEKSHDSSGINGEDESKEIALFPSRNDLAKRAKYVLSNMFKSDGNCTSNKNQGVQMKFGYALINQGNSSNFFLSELLRLLTRIHGKNLKIAREILAVVIREAEELHSLSIKKDQKIMLNKTESEAFQNIARHLRLLTTHSNIVSRQVKNIFRVILGMEPNKSTKHSSKGLFPVYEMPIPQQSKSKPPDASSNISETENTTKTRKLILRDSASGDIAIGKALESYLYEHKRNETFLASQLKITSFETLMLSVVCSQGLPVWSEGWEELTIPNVSPKFVTMKNPEKGKEFRITWIGMGLVIERAAHDWKRKAHEELTRVTQKLKEAKTPQFIKSLSDKLDVLKHDSKTKDEAYNEAFIASKDPLLLAKKVVMLLEALRVRMGSVEFYRGSSQKRMKISTNSDSGIGPRVLSWMAKELINWAKCLGIMDVSTRSPCAFTSVPNQNSSHEVRAVAVLDQSACRKIFAQVSQQCRLRSVIVTNGLSGILEWVPRAVRALKKNDDGWIYQPWWWDTDESKRCFNDINLICGTLNYGYSGFHKIINHYASFRKYVYMKVPQYNRFSVSVVQPRVNQLTRELSLLEDNASVTRLLGERAIQSSTGVKRASPSASTNTIQTGLASFFKPPPKPMGEAKPFQETRNLAQSTSKSPSPVEKNVRYLVPSKRNIGSNIIDLCEASSDDEKFSY